METLDKGLPQHIAIIVDGNRRWARERGFPTLAGHKKGAERVGEIVKYAQELGIKIITIYAFSTENWRRQKEEVSYLMGLFDDYARSKIDEARDLGIQVRILGDIHELPNSLQKALSQLMEATRNNEKLIFNIAINYGGRDELVRAFRKLLLANVPAADLSEELISNNLDTAGLPDPDLIIRTSGEQRLSNFLPWQGTYSELYFPQVYWPDFDKEQFDIALEEFRKRQRRMGK